MPLQSASSRWLAGIAIAVVVLVAASVALVLFDRRGEPELFPPESPEGAVQRYLLAVDGREDREAYGYLGPELSEECGFDHFRESVRNFQPGNGRRDQDLRVSLIGTEAVDETTEVSVRVTRYRVDPPFGGDEYSSRRMFVLEEIDGDWRFTEPPWPMSWCPEPEQPETGLGPAPAGDSG